MSRIVIVPGMVDGKWVDAAEVARRYGVPQGKYVIWDTIAMPHFRPEREDVVLYIRLDGDYTLPKAAKELL